MKKWSFLVRVSLIALITVTGSYAQNNTTNNSNKGFYFRVGGGYITQTGKTEFNNADPNGITGIQQSTDISTDGSTIHVKALNGTMGAGYKFNVTGGYMFNKYLGAELGLNYFNGDKTRIGRYSSPVLMSDEQAYIRGLDIMPALYLTPGFKKVNPYARIGAIMTGAGKLYIETNAKQINGGGAGTDIVVNAKSEVKSDFSVGFAGAAGVTVPLNDKIDLFGEVEFKNFSIKSKSAKIVEYSTQAVTNGQAVPVPGQQLEDLPVSQKEFIFSDNYTLSATSPAATNEPRTIPTQYVNTSGAGINIGIRFTI